jgi:hypothetical protein
MVRRAGDTNLLIAYTACRLNGASLREQIRARRHRDPFRGGRMEYNFFTFFGTQIGKKILLHRKIYFAGPFRRFSIKPLFLQKNWQDLRVHLAGLLLLGRFDT